MKVIISADDYGLCRSVSNGIKFGYQYGIVSSTTIMAATIGEINLDQVLKSMDGLELSCGIHLQLTGGQRQFLVKGQGITVYDQRLPTHPSLVNFSADEAYEEWNEQIRLCFKYGLKATHLDTHHGLHRDQRYTQVYLDLAKYWGLPVRGHDRAFKELANACGVLCTAQVNGSWTGGRVGELELLDEIEETAKNLSRDDFCEVITHPGYSSDELRTISMLNDLREQELSVLTSKTLIDEFRVRNWELTNFKSLVNGS